MDTKKIIQKLVALAEKQQKIITKLAQAVPAAQTGPELAPQHLDPNKPNLRPAEAVLNALSPNTRKTVVNLEEHGSDMMVGFAPGQKTQQNYDAVLATLQKLTNQGVLQRAYNLKAV